MMRTVYLHYVVKGQPVVLGFDQAGNLVCLHLNGVDFTSDGNVAYEVFQILEERGVNLQEAISTAFEKSTYQPEIKSASNC